MCQSKDKNCFPYLKNIAFWTSTLTMQSVHKNTEENAYYPYSIDFMRMIFWVLKRFIVLKIYWNYWIILFQEIGCYAYRHVFCIGRLFGEKTECKSTYLNSSLKCYSFHASWHQLWLGENSTSHSFYCISLEKDSRAFH